MEDNSEENLRTNNHSSNESNGLAIASLVLGIISICTGYLGVIFGIIGIPLAISSRKKGQNSLATAGLVTSIIGLVLGLILIIVVGCMTCITTTAGNSGILAQAETARENLKEADIIERIELAYSAAKLDSKLDSSKTITSCFKDELKKEFKNEDYIYYLTGSDTLGWKVYVDGTIYKVTSSGTVTKN